MQEDIVYLSEKLQIKNDDLKRLRILLSMLSEMDLQFKANLKQGQALRYLLDDVTTEVWYWGAAWGGKSYLWVFWVRMMCTKYPQTRWFFWRKELTNLRKTTLNSYYKFLGEYDIPESNRGKLNWQDNTIRFDNWSEILLLDLAYQPSDPLYTRFGSLELTGWFIDESNEVDAQAIMILNTRVGRQNNSKYWIKPKVLETFNPDKGHVYERYYKAYKSRTLPEYRQFIPALATDNPHIDQNYIEQLQKADETTKQRLLYWNFDYDDTAGKLFTYNEIYDSFNITIAPDTRKYLSCDIARLWNDNTVIWYWKGLELIQIFSYNGLTTDITSAKIKELEQEYRIPRANIIIDSDWVGWWVADQLRWCVNFINNWKAIDEFWKTNNFGNLKTQCYFKLKELMEKRWLRINAEWKHKDSLMQELSNILLKNELSDTKIMLESKDDMKRRIGRSPDIADMVMMRMYYEIKPVSKKEQTEIFTVNYDNVLY